MKYLILFFLLCIILFGLNRKHFDVKPIKLNNSHICACDNMTIINYYGPKAQILWKDGSRSFFCEVREGFYEILNPNKKKFILAFYVQDFSNLKWDSYTNQWTIAEKMFYVVNSNKYGAMGPSYVPFSDIESAKNFNKNYGGKILNFYEIDINIINESSNLMKNKSNFNIE